MRVQRYRFFEELPNNLARQILILPKQFEHRFEVGGAFAAFPALAGFADGAGGGGDAGFGTVGHQVVVHRLVEFHHVDRQVEAVLRGHAEAKVAAVLGVLVLDLAIDAPETLDVGGGVAVAFVFVEDPEEVFDVLAGVGQADRQPVEDLFQVVVFHLADRLIRCP